jgi:DNA-binding response OmpR family regulator
MDFTAEHNKPARKMRILIVDDDPDCAELFKVVLETSGHDVHVTNNAESVWLYTGLHEVNLFLVDLGLPGIDGATLIRTLRERVGRHIPIGVVSGFQPGSVQHRQATSLQTDFYLTKPVDLRALVSTVCAFE